SPAVTACSSGSSEPAKDADSAKKDDDSASSGDPVEEMQKISDGIQKDVDAVLQPIKDADAILDSIVNLPKDLKAAKSKADAKKIMIELKKVVDGGEVKIEVLKLDEPATKIVTERHEKLKALMASLKDIDTKAKELAQHAADAAPKIAAAAGKAIPKLEA